MNIGKHLSYLYEPVHGHCTAVCDGMVIQVTAELVPDENTSSSMSAQSVPSALRRVMPLNMRFHRAVASFLSTTTLSDVAVGDSVDCRRISDQVVCASARPVLRGCMNIQLNSCMTRCQRAVYSSPHQPSPVHNHYE